MVLCIKTTARVTFLLRNETVKTEYGNIISYDKRILPNQVESTIIRQIITNQSDGPVTVNNIYTYPNNDLEFYYLDKPKENTPLQVLSKSYFELKFKNTTIDYIGALTLGEIIIEN